MPQYDSFLFGSNLYDGSKSSPSSLSTDLIVFDGFSLSDNSSIFTQDLFDSAPRRDILDGKIPRDHGLYFNSMYEREKVITVRGFCKKSTSAELEAFLDTIRQELSGREKYLDITRGSTVRRYVATLQNPEALFSDRQKYHVTYCPFRASFIAHSFATDRGYTSFSEEVTTSPHNITFENSGTAEAELSVILIFSAASSVTAVKIENTTTGEEIQYSGSISSTDVVKFDGENKQVVLNGSNVEYSGAFPKLNPGSNLIQITVTGSSFTAYATAKTLNAYL